MDNSKNLVDRVKNGARSFVDDTKKYVSAVADGSKKLAVYGLVGAVALTAGARVAGAGDLPDGFIDLINPPSGVRSQFIGMNDAVPYNLMIRDDEGIANIVSNNGVEVWRIGFAKDSGDGTIQFGGYANTNNHNADTYEGFEGWCLGAFYDNVFADGDTADAVFIVHDLLGDGPGEIVSTPSGNEWRLRGDDTLYSTNQVEFNGILGDISQMQPFNYTQVNILPQMIINDRPPRTGPAGMEDLVALSENWLRQDCQPYGVNSSDGADWDFDGDVDFKDFSYMAQGWDPDYVSE